MESLITVEDLRTMLLIVPYNTAMDVKGNLYIRGNLICNIITLLQENNGMQEALERLTISGGSVSVGVATFVQKVLDDPIGWIR